MREPAISAVFMEALAEKIPGEICREEGMEAMAALPQEGLVIKVPPGLERHRQEVAHEGEGRHGVVLEAEDLVGFLEKATDNSSNLI